MFTKEIAELDKWLSTRRELLDEYRIEFDRQSNDANNHLGIKIRIVIDEINTLEKCKKLLIKKGK